jgi:microcystin degradation protein MlrC
MPNPDRRPMRAGVLGLSHESNTFSPIPTPLDAFQLLEGDAIREVLGGSYRDVAGLLSGLDDEGVTAVPLVSADATPSAAVAADASAALSASMERALDRAGRLDGLLVALHGAAVGETHRDLDGHWLGWLRRRAGDGVPLICTVDAHANISHAMVDACDAIIAYGTNPHLDTFDRGVEAARLLARTLRGEVRPTQAAALPPVAINILAQETAAPPCRPLYDLAGELRGRDGVLSVSVALGFPYADVHEMGSGFVVVTDGRPDLARSLAGELAAYLVGHRDEFVPDMVDAEDAVRRAARAPGPVCLLDTGDNVGGGSPGDATTIAHAVARRGGPRTFVSLYDPASARQAAAAGVGARVRLSVGGKCDDQHGAPLDVEGVVRGRYDGRFTEPEVRHGGAVSFDMGETVVVDTDRGLTVQLISERVMPVSLNQLSCCGLDPRDYQILVAKGVHAPLPAYRPVCPTVIRATTPGCTTPDVARLDYRYRRRPLFPFEPIN